MKFQLQRSISTPESSFHLQIVPGIGSTSCSQAENLEECDDETLAVTEMYFCRGLQPTHWIRLQPNTHKGVPRYWRYDNCHERRSI